MLAVEEPACRRSPPKSANSSDAIRSRLILETRSQLLGSGFAHAPTRLRRPRGTCCTVALASLSDSRGKRLLAPHLGMAYTVGPDGCVGEYVHTPTARGVATIGSYAVCRLDPA